ncbi:ATPase [Sphingomonas lacunae]|uniref:histidine kinase n=1 Tax=Sphingomonas lacunae TaxID=2698828 RepID=A0A6M4ATU6_9SPHN|nr:ATP-binding protein [Sphingomonas lacunae]QJQ32495.1 ATPase [Sphingomonas lacunae]
MTRLPALLIAALVMLLAGTAVALSVSADWIGIVVMMIAGLVAIGVMATNQLMPVAEPAVTMVSGDDRPLEDQPRFAAFIDAISVPLLLVKDARVMIANNAARGLLGDFITGVDVRSAVRHPAAADRLANLDRTDPATIATPIDLIGIGGPGARWEMRTMLLEDGSCLVALTDHSGRDAIERMRADFVANASHELRTPLAAILGFVETLSDPAAGGDAEVRQRFLGVIDKEARRMQQLVEDLLSMSRIEASKSQAPTERLEWGALIRQVVAELTAAGDKRAADVRMELGPAAPILADPAQMSQLLHNIIGNAMKYGRAGTPVTVRLGFVGGQMAELAVSDESEGIAPEHLPRLTERFYRVDSARSRSLGGTGLGLAIVKHVVERHRGRLDIDSVVGVGTTVKVRLPLITD